MSEKVSGNLIIIGGAEDKKGDKDILRRVAKYIDPEKERLIIATIATQYPEQSYQNYKEVFTKLGIKNIAKLDISTRDDAFNKENIKLINTANLLFFTGGDQLRITSMIGGTPIYNSIKELCNNGGLIAGTSAGASVMSDTMIVQGEDDESPHKCTLKMSPGLGLVNNIIIDQHFAQRGRIGRLLTAIAQNPEVLGIGIDEDTAIVVSDKGTAEVIGSGAVYFIDGSSIDYSNVSEQYSEEVLSMFNVKLHVLKEGNRFNLIDKVPFEEDKNFYENHK
ncbi:cyanophycinase [Clostridium sp. D53t1_180928_C8]|uniref:cyanophycinase n=1 Tax=Clostridium sp. D53t1_180928_C8 TaxID=2787101 RepID=UPI0018ABCDAA|nr:cyanophycinase [Clostridium sp. D53t1_180928_C8]